jgi:hypothetical protein
MTPPTQYLMRAIMAELGTDEPCVTCPTENYRDVHWCDVAEADRPSSKAVARRVAAIKKEEAATAYIAARRAAYPPIGDQLDALFHAGAFPDDMAAQLQAVKDSHPKAGD